MRPINASFAPPPALRAGFPAVLLGLAMLVQPARAEDMDWLRQMADAVRTRNYQGVVVYGSGADMRTLRIVHRFQQGREQERMQTLSGPAVEILRDDNMVTCIHPRNRQVKMGRRELRGLLRDVAQLGGADLRSGYEIRRMDDTRLLQRDCRVYVFVPRDEYRYGYRIYADAVTALPLKLETLGANQTTVEQLMFTQIEYPESIPDEALMPAEDPSRYEWTRHDKQEQVRLSGASTWKAQRLPPGFRLIGFSRRQPPNAVAPVEHLLFSDGLSTVSVFVTPIVRDGEVEGTRRIRHLQGLSRMGVISAYGRDVGSFRINVMGEVPAVTVEEIGDNLTQTPAEPGVPSTALVPSTSPSER